MDQRINMITLGVDDLAAARRFFEDGLGWRPAGFDSEAIAFYDAGGTALALFGRGDLAADAGIADDGRGFSGVTIAWNGASEAAVDAAFARAVAAGAEPVKTPVAVFWGGYSGYVRIPGGHLLEIAFNPVFPLDDCGRVTLPSPKE
ncbi:MAG TPA: VOC family protein [Hyphomicrobiales bacterium]|nr:VOC family protein [Kaistiaceae bacterium]HQF31527.1 VOC family protein [Hyphomicrobiales bacterium]